MNYKRSFSLLELILVIFISSILIIYSFTFIKQLHQVQFENQNLAILKIDLNSTKIFIENNILKIEDNLRYENNTLFYKNYVLLQNVTSFSMSKHSRILKIDINLDKKIQQSWEFSL
ncbi:MAG: hypothetical protein GY932_07395 [Arcobacter sp.]|nr:hypothetical protein [Arcobacter sp.]